MIWIILKWFFILVEIALIALILLRKSDSSGLSSTFGGAGGDSAFGVKTQKQLDKTITWVAVFFMLIAIFLNRQTLSAAKAENAPTTQEAPTDQKK